MANENSVETIIENVLRKESLSSQVKSKKPADYIKGLTEFFKAQDQLVKSMRSLGISEEYLEGFAEMINDAKDEYADSIKDPEEKQKFLDEVQDEFNF